LPVLAIELILLIIYFINKNKLKELNPIVVYTIVSILFTFLINSLFFKLTGKKFFGYRIFTAIEGVCFGYYFYFIIQYKIAKKILIVLGVVFLALALFDLKNSQADTFDSIPTVIECLILLSFSVYYLYEQIKEPNNLFLYNSPNFWIVVGIILFFSGNFFLFIYGQTSYNLPLWENTFTLINGVCSLLEYSLFLVAFIIAKNTSKNQKSNIIIKKPRLQY
jgi:hypothetical protein